MRFPVVDGHRELRTVATDGHRLATAVLRRAGRAKRQESNNVQRLTPERGATRRVAWE
jgi:hypothetical protein